MALVTVTPPSAEPVLLTEIKDYLRIDAGDTSQDTLLESLVTAARVWAEAFTGRRFLTQTVRLYLDFFPGYIPKLSTIAGEKRYEILLPCAPVQSINVFQYIDVNGTTTALTQGVNYVADLVSKPARLTPPFGLMWPCPMFVPNSVQIQYVVGYGADGSTVPETIKTGIKLLAAHWFENRLPDDTDIPAAVKAVLYTHRDRRF